MSAWYTVLLGIVQGLTEFLPVSSSGHLVLVQSLLGTNGFDPLTIDVWLHMGTLLSALICFREDLRGLARAGFRICRRRPEDAENRRLLGLLAAALLPMLAAPLVMPFSPAIASDTVALDTTDSGDAVDDASVVRQRLETTAETLFVN